jgi:hypothetical protein
MTDAMMLDPNCVDDGAGTVVCTSRAGEGFNIAPRCHDGRAANVTSILYGTNCPAQNDCAAVVQSVAGVDDPSFVLDNGTCSFDPSPGCAKGAIVHYGCN